MSSTVYIILLNLLFSYALQQNLIQKRAELQSSLAIRNSVAKTESLSKETDFEILALEYIEDIYKNSGKIKCPFFRRRTTDFLDAIDSIVRLFIVRHKSLNLPLGLRIKLKPEEKVRHLKIDDIYNILLTDWRIHSHKGYYITGRLNTTIYRDDCYFDGPDPDMPVLGLRKYLDAASQLFEHSSSRAELKSIRIENPKLLVVKWQIEGVLKLPWHPVIPAWSGTTKYHLDEENLIHFHEESWDISVAEAFTRVLLPRVWHLLWNQTSIL